MCIVWLSQDEVCVCVCVCVRASGSVSHREQQMASWLLLFSSGFRLSSRNWMLISPPPSLLFKFKRAILARDVNIYTAKSSVHNEAQEMKT